MKTISQEQLNNCYSYSDVCRFMDLSLNGTGRRMARWLCEDLDTSHFDPKHRARRHKIITKECPVCNKQFQTKATGRESKTTCGYACSNTYFRSGPNNPNWKESSYQSTCFHYHGKECWVCGENRIVAVHHIDEDHHNHDPSNLAPLCPTHHQYWHSEHKYLIKDIVLKRQLAFIQANN